MSRICKSDDHKFLAFTMYSARYEDKALRLPTLTLTLTLTLILTLTLTRRSAS